VKKVSVSISDSSAAVQLPPPRAAGAKSLEECLRERRSCRAFTGRTVALSEAGQLLWAAQGVTGLGGLRTAPSAGAIYPLHAYLLALEVDGLRRGVYVYDPDRHALSLWKGGDLRPRLAKTVFDQQETEGAALGILLTANYGRSTREFGDRGPILAHIEAGHVGQNICLQATALSLGVIGLGKIDAASMRSVLDVPAPEEPLYLVLCGAK
jgi:SagB-type dehydrogenase family enzyme